jgi:hypothetical protein
MRTTPIANRLFYFSILILVLTSIIVASSNVAYADTAVVSGSIRSGVDITETVHISVNNLNIANPDAQLAYNAPIPASNSVSGYSESVSNVNIAVSPAPNNVADMTDQFGNPYRQFTWNVFQSNGSAYDITVTTTFHADITGDASPANYEDPVGTSAMSQYLSSTSMVQANDQAIKDKAAQLVSGATSEADAVDRIMNFVKSNMPNDNPNPPQQDAVWSLTSSSGSCVNRADLALALMRSVGIPGRYVSGYVYGDEIAVSYSVAGGQATSKSSWASGPHTWVEVYYPNEGVWVPYDPFMEKGFVDSRHVKIRVSLDDDTTSANYRSTHGDSGLFTVGNVNQEVSVSMSSSISRASLQDDNKLQQYGSTQSAPSGFMLARSLQNVATATPTATPTATATASPTSTVSPSANASVTPTPSAGATASPGPAANSSTSTPAASPTAVTGDSENSYKLSGIVMSATTQKPIQGATVICGEQTIRTDDNGIFAFFEPNGTAILNVSADGYIPDSRTIVVSGLDQSASVELNPLSSASAAPSVGSSFPVPGPTLLITIAIFTGSAALLWRVRDR